MHHQLTVESAGTATATATGAPAEATAVYRVATPAGLTKRGQWWPQGATIELAPSVAQRFIDLGELTP